VDGVEIGWDEARAANLANWEDRVPLHVEAYATEQLVTDPAHLSSVVRTDLAALAPFLPGGTIKGLDVCHLQCHIGTDTLSLAKAGAVVVGVDFSPSALAAAGNLAERLGIDATWIETDVLEARAAVDVALGTGRLFDLVYTSIGTISWLNDLDRWAAQVAALLRPGGIFYIRDGHPALYSLDEESKALSIKYRYFGNGTALQWDDEGTYAGDGRIEHSRTYDWPHPISEVVTVLLRHGLTLLALDEGRTLPWQFAPRMIANQDGDYAWPGPEADLIPCTFTVVARRD
jgi:SAM-dependent methyltransferase